MKELLTSLEPQKMKVVLEEKEKIGLSHLVAEFILTQYENEGHSLSPSEVDILSRTCAALARFLHEKCDVYAQLDLYLAIKSEQENDEDEEDPVDDIKN